MAVRSISASQLTSELHDAIGKVSAKHSLLKDVKSPEFVMTPWLIGFILRDLNLEKETLGRLHALSADLQAALPSAHAGTPAALIQDKHIIMGFFPDAKLPMFQLK